MRYGLVATIAQPLTYWVESIGDPFTNEPPYVRGHLAHIVAEPGTIINLIVYDGDQYTPPDGLRLAEVPDDAKIGDTGY